MNCDVILKFIIYINEYFISQLLLHAINRYRSTYVTVELFCNELCQNVSLNTLTTCAPLFNLNQPVTYFIHGPKQISVPKYICVFALICMITIAGSQLRDRNPRGVQNGRSIDFSVYNGGKLSI